MKPQELPQPHEPKEPICTNSAYYELFATYEEKQEWISHKARIENDRNESRYDKLLYDLDLIDTNQRGFYEFINELNK